MRELEALQVWLWLRWRLPPDLYMECQQALFEGPAPAPTDPQIAAGFAELQDPETTRARKLQILRQLLTLLKNSGIAPP